MRPPYGCNNEVGSVSTWRYLNMRILLHRTVVLSTTERRIPFARLDPEERIAVQRCRDLAEEAILNIRAEMRPNRMSGWQGVWFLFQAALIPLMALAVEDERDPQYAKWSELVVLAIQLCEEMEPWSLVGKKLKELLQRLFEATKRPAMTLSPASQSTLAQANHLDAAGQLMRLGADQIQLPPIPVTCRPDMGIGLLAPSLQQGFVGDSGFWSDVMRDEYFTGWEEMPSVQQVQNLYGERMESSF